MRTYEFRLYPTREQRRRRKMARSVAQTHLKIERQRRDFHFKTAKRYADVYQTIVVEDLNIRALARSRVAKSILDAGWSAFLNILTCKAASAGGEVVRINPRFTTQQCSKCGELVQKSLSVRTHICPSCGYVADRDVNAAKNILKAGAPPSGTLAAGLAVERGALWAKPNPLGLGVVTILCYKRLRRQIWRCGSGCGDWVERIVPLTALGSSVSAPCTEEQPAACPDGRLRNRTLVLCGWPRGALYCWGRALCFTRVTRSLSKYRS